jgi:hypothetical protein
MLNEGQLRRAEAVALFLLSVVASFSLIQLIQVIRANHQERRIRDLAVRFEDFAADLARLRASEAFDERARKTVPRVTFSIGHGTGTRESNADKANGCEVGSEEALLPANHS